MRLRDSALLLIVCVVFCFSIAAAEAHAKNNSKFNQKPAQKAKIQSKAEKKKKKVNPKAGQEKKGVQAKAVYCVNLRNNETLLARNPDQQLPVASLTKLVTAMVALDKLKLDQKIGVPEHIKSVPKSVVGLKPGDTVSVEDVLHGLLIGSGNDCAETLACAYPGGRNTFIAAMNKKVRSMGMKQTKFFTPSGLDHKKDGDEKACEVDSNVSTAREIASIAKEAFDNPVIRMICLKQNHIIASEMDQSVYYVRTTNKLLRDKLPIVGGKTGYTSKAGHCLASEFRPGKNVFLIVVLGSPDHFRDTRLVYHKAVQESSKLRFTNLSDQEKLAARNGN